MDLDAAKLINGTICRYAMLAAFGCLLLTAAIILFSSVGSAPGNDIAQYPPSHNRQADRL